MSNAIFPFAFLRSGFVEYVSYRNEAHEQGGGRRVLQKIHAGGELVVRGRLLFPLKGRTYADFEAFWNARFGGFDPFLYKPQNPGAKTVTDGPEVDSSSQKDFPASRRYIDTATLVVKKNGVTQTLGTHYSLQNESGGAYVLGTSTRLTVHFVNAPGTSATVTLTYEFFFPVRFEGDDLPDDQEIETGGAGSAKVADRTVGVRMREAGPGYSYANTPNAL